VEWPLDLTFGILRSLSATSGNGNVEPQSAILWVTKWHDLKLPSLLAHRVLGGRASIYIQMRSAASVAIAASWLLEILIPDPKES